MRDVKCHAQNNLRTTALDSTQIKKTPLLNSGIFGTAGEEWDMIQSVILKQKSVLIILNAAYM